MRTTVADVMTTDVIAARPDTPFRELAEMLTSRHISAVPVVDVQGLVVGVVSEADLMLKEIIDPHHGHFESAVQKSERRKADGVLASDLMSSPAITIDPAALLAQAAHVLHDRGVKRLPVVDDDGRLLGIVTRGDLLAVFMRRDEEIRKEIIQEVMIRILWMDPARLDIGVTSGVVSLRGRVDRRSDIDILVGFIRGVEGVVAVRCELGFAYDDVRGAMSAAWRAVI